MPSHIPIPIPPATIEALCKRWGIVRLGLIGSAFTPEATQESDVDIVLQFDPATTWDMFDIVRLREECAAIFGRPVDIIEEGAVRNPYMKDSIHRTQRVLYAASLPDGTRVKVPVERKSKRRAAKTKSLDSLSRIGKRAVKTGIRSLADDHDGHAYGLRLCP